MMHTRRSNYDKEPSIQVRGFAGHGWRGWPEIVDRLQAEIGSKGSRRTIVVVDLYYGASAEEIRSMLSDSLRPSLVISTSVALLPEARLRAMLDANITEDRVFGYISDRVLGDFFDPDQLASLRTLALSAEGGLVLVIGVGASLVVEGDLLVYADMARWEIQQRMRRSELGNLGFDNQAEDMQRKYKQAFFVDWRVLDRHKVTLLDRISYLLDTNRPNDPRMTTGEAFREGLAQAGRQPFRVVPYFDPGPWGGQWMKEVCDLDRSASNYAWCFDCVPEENSLYLDVDGVRLEIPAIDLVFHQPQELLGAEVHARFGAEFPIRFDFLDTMGGGNLSLQVHPLKDYIRRTFGMGYTQDESYYILDAGEEASVFLGLQEELEPEDMMTALERAQQGGPPFRADEYINRWPARKHDHFLIPAGTIHCSGRNTMVLEISATPYIFTFKLWDWGRLGLDGQPRPIHLEHGRAAIQWNRRTSWVAANLINRVEVLCSGEGWHEERTGLHEWEFIETRRHWFSVPLVHETHGTVHVMNLVEGEEVILESLEGAFEPFPLHYAETVIIPAAVSSYRVRPVILGAGGACATIKAFVRG